MCKTICFEFVTPSSDTFEEFKQSTDNHLSVWLAVTMVMSEWVFIEHRRQSEKSKVTHVQNFSQLSQLILNRNKERFHAIAPCLKPQVQWYSATLLNSACFKLPDQHTCNDRTPLSTI